MRGAMRRCASSMAAQSGARRSVLVDVICCALVLLLLSPLRTPPSLGTPGITTIACEQNLGDWSPAKKLAAEALWTVPICNSSQANKERIAARVYCSRMLPFSRILLDSSISFVTLAFTTLPHGE